MRLVLDTNVLIAAFVADGLCKELLEHCYRRHSVVLSDFIIAELREKLANKFGYSDLSVAAIIEFVSLRSQFIEPQRLTAAVARDPDDDNILATAMTGRCECVITGDKDLLELVEFEGARLMSPRQFLEFEDRGTDGVS